MRTRVKLRPGQRGTKRWLEQYGDQLICVRYRYDAGRRRRYTTVESIVAEGDWTPPPPSPDTIVGLRVAWGEVAVAGRIKAAGGTWNRRRWVWGLAYGQAAALDTGQWAREAQAIHQARLASGDWQATDQTGTRVGGHNQVCHVVGNRHFTSYHTRPGGSRQDVLAVLWSQEPRFRLNADGLAWLAEMTCRPTLLTSLRDALPWDTELTDAD